MKKHDYRNGQIVRALDVSSNRYVQGKVVNVHEYGLCLDDHRGVRYYVYYRNCYGEVIEQNNDLFGPLRDHES